MTLHKAEGRNTYCGPAALSILTGKPTHDTARAIREVTGKQRVFGVSNGALERTARHMGLELFVVADYRGNGTSTRPTFTQWLQRRVALREQGGKANGTYIVTLTGHYVVVQIDGPHVRISDRSNHAVSFEKYGRPRKRVKVVWKVVES